MVTFELDGGESGAFRFLNALQQSHAVKDFERIYAPGDAGDFPVK